MQKKNHVLIFVGNYHVMNLFCCSHELVPIAIYYQVNCNKKICIVEAPEKKKHCNPIYSEMMNMIAMHKPNMVIAYSWE
jgi:hypothetical protein